MSLYGALFTGVTGLRAQGTAIGIVSDNIANMNTTGYKAASAVFKTLVNPGASTGTYSPGGVSGSNKQLIDRQGLLQSTDSSTDIAVSGNGFFTVGRNASSDSDIYFTRAGSFSPDNKGNYRNANGYYLLGWPLDRDGRLPGVAGNVNTTSSADLDSLQPVNLESSGGVATSTTSIKAALNLKASEALYTGAGATAEMVSDVNTALPSTSVLAPTTLNGTSTNNMILGDELQISTSEGLVYTYQYGGFSTSAVPASWTGLGATQESSTFIDPASLTGADTDDRTFTIATPNLGTFTFTYKQSSPNTTSGEFNSMKTLAEAIDLTSGLQARIVNSGATARIVMAPKDANESMTFTSGGSVVDWESLVAATYTTPTGINNFASIDGLATLLNKTADLKAEIANPLTSAELTINAANPLIGIRFDDANTSATPNILTEMGLARLDDTPVTSYLGPIYDPQRTQLYTTTDDSYQTLNMAHGDIKPHFSRNIRVYDSLGTGHDLTMGFLKVGTNQWAVEVWASKDNDIQTTLIDDQLARGNIYFNGDGSLKSIDPGLKNSFTALWQNGAEPSTLTINWGTAGKPFGTPGETVFGLTDGLSQFDAAYNVSYITQNGAQVGSLTGVTINPEGFVIASYSNGQTQRLYKLPLADFSNPNGLRTESGNVFAQTDDSGDVNLRESGSSGVGKIASGALEQSNVELASELTNMIVAQRAYQASSKVITTSNELLDALTRL